MIRTVDASLNPPELTVKSDIVGGPNGKPSRRGITDRYCSRQVFCQDPQTAKSKKKNRNYNQRLSANQIASFFTWHVAGRATSSGICRKQDDILITAVRMRVKGVESGRLKRDTEKHRLGPKAE